MRELAQTNLQLYGQVVEQAWEPEDLAALRRGYELACDLFSGLYRPSGKPFVAHLVGTASCVALVDGRVDLVTAAVLHATYQGDFGWRERRAVRREIVRSAIGARAEELVWAYAAQPWDADSIRGMLVDLDAQTSTTRDVLIIRLSNEVDEHVDRGSRIADRNGDALYREDVVASMSELATQLGNPELGDLLQRVRREAGERPPVAELRSTDVDSVPRPPPSKSQVVVARVEGGWRKLRRTVSRLPGVRSLASARRRRARRP